MSENDSINSEKQNAILFAILNSPFMVTFIGGLLLAIIGTTYQLYQKNWEMHNENRKFIIDRRMASINEFTDNFYKLDQASADQMDYIIQATRIQSKSIPIAKADGTLYNKIIESQNLVRESKPMRGLVYKIRAFFPDSTTSNLCDSVLFYYDRSGAIVDSAIDIYNSRDVHSTRKSDSLKFCFYEFKNHMERFGDHLVNHATKNLTRDIDDN